MLRVSLIFLGRSSRMEVSVVSELRKVRLNMVLRFFRYLVVFSSVCFNQRIYFLFLSFWLLFTRSMQHLSQLAANCFLVLGFFLFYLFQNRCQVIGNLFRRRRCLNLKVNILLFLLNLFRFILFYLALLDDYWLITLFFRQFRQI